MHQNSRKPIQQLLRLKENRLAHYHFSSVGLPYVSEQYGWLLTPVVGQWQGSNSGADSAGEVAG